LRLQGATRTSRKISNHFKTFSRASRLKLKTPQDFKPLQNLSLDTSRLQDLFRMQDASRFTAKAQDASKPQDSKTRFNAASRQDASICKILMTPDASRVQEPAPASRPLAFKTPQDLMVSRVEWLADFKSPFKTAGLQETSSSTLPVTQWETAQ
jgi:hypothetical protein